MGQKKNLWRHQQVDVGLQCPNCDVTIGGISNDKKYHYGKGKISFNTTDW